MIDRVRNDEAQNVMNFFKSEQASKGRFTVPELLAVRRIYHEETEALELRKKSNTTCLNA